MSAYYIYKMTILPNDLYEGIYIGQHKIGSKDPSCDNYKGSGSDWKKYIIKTKIPVKKEILRLCDNLEESNHWEKYYIEQAKQNGEHLWNLLKGGGNHEPYIRFTKEELREHSITRIGADDKGIPQYNFDLCQIGATQASIRAIKFCREKNPFNGGITRFATEMMIGHYFTYIECLERKPVFAEQNLFNAKRFYHEAYKEIEHLINDKTLKDMYTMQYAGHSQQLIGIIPQISFNEFFDKVKNDKYDGENELKEIRSKFSKEILDNDKKCGVAIW